MQCNFSLSNYEADISLSYDTFYILFSNGGNKLEEKVKAKVHSAQSIKLARNRMDAQKKHYIT